MPGRPLAFTGHRSGPVARMLTETPAFRSRRASAAIAAAWLRNDISAGLAIAAVGLPSAIAYPAIAGLPPRDRHLRQHRAAGRLRAVRLVAPADRRAGRGDDDRAGGRADRGVLAAAAGASRPTASAVAAVLALMVGALCLLARLLRLGVLASFLSRPILVGFFAGISLSILVGQIGRFTGVSRSRPTVWSRPSSSWPARPGAIHWPSLLLGLAMFVLLQVVQADPASRCRGRSSWSCSRWSSRRLRLRGARHRGRRRHPGGPAGADVAPRWRRCRSANSCSGRPRCSS